MNQWEQLLTERATEIGLKLSEQQAGQFSTYRKLLLEWNEKMNLTAITDDEGILYKHFLDSVMIWKELPQNARIIDVGTGAGFPGVPLAIVRPDLEITLLDSLNKRLIFLNELIGALGLEHISTVHLRAEEGGRAPEYREQFDAAVSRAVAALPVLCEFCMPYIRPGGMFFAYKGAAAEEELSQSGPAIAALGGGDSFLMEALLPGTAIAHKVIMLKKVRQTPAKYPRQFKKITSQPIK